VVFTLVHSVQFASQIGCEDHLGNDP